MLNKYDEEAPLNKYDEEAPLNKYDEEAPLNNHHETETAIHRQNCKMTFFNSKKSTAITALWALTAVGATLTTILSLTTGSNGTLGDTNDNFHLSMATKISGGLTLLCVVILFVQYGASALSEDEPEPRGPEGYLAKPAHP